MDFDPRTFTKDPDFQEILYKGYDDTKFFAKVFFPEIFELPFSNLHDQIFEAIDSPDPQVVIAAPRGLGKTSIARIYASKKILYRDSRFITYISNSATMAEMQTENIKMSLRSSKDVRDIWGDIKTNRYDDGGRDQFSLKTWIANGYTIMLPRGSLQQIRGLNWTHFRPDLFIFDDLEDTETLDNELIRQKRKVWFFSDAMKARPTGAHAKYKMIYIDTVKHEDSLIEELLFSDGWSSLRLSICTDKYETLAPEFTSQKELDIEIADHRKRHLMDLFARERMSVPISREAAAFKASYFQYYKETDEDFVKRKRFIENVLIVDPAKGTNPKNAQSAFVVWGIDTETHKWHLREARGEYYHPEEIYADAFKTALSYNIRVIGLETAGLKEFILYPFKNAMIAAGYNFEIVELMPRAGKGEFAGVGGGKKARIASMIPFYRKGTVYHNEVNCNAYETQLLGFPKSKLWDIMDAAGYIVEMLEMGLRYFMPKDFSEKDEKEMEKEFKQLDVLYVDEDPFESYQVNDCPELRAVEGVGY